MLSTFTLQYQILEKKNSLDAISLLRQTFENLIKFAAQIYSLFFSVFIFRGQEKGQQGRY